MTSIKKLLALFAICLMIPAITSADDLIIIANQNVPDDTLKSKELRQIYYGKRTRWSNGSPLIPVSRRRGPTQDTFVSDVLRKSFGQYESFWRQALFTGEGIPPRSFESEADLIKYIIETPGALGFVESISDSINVKKLVIID